MINFREAEIREESLLLTVAAYEVVSSLNTSSTAAQRNGLVDGSFNVSSLIAEAFRTSHPGHSANCLKIALGHLAQLTDDEQILRPYCLDQGTNLDEFIHRAQELQVELTELLSALNLQNAENFSPKLEIACF